MPFATPFNHYNNKYVYMDFFLYARWFFYAFDSNSLLLLGDGEKEKKESKRKKGRSVKNGKFSIEMLFVFFGETMVRVDFSLLDYVSPPPQHLMGALYVQYMDHTEGSSRRENEIKGDIFEIYIKRSFEFGAVLGEEKKGNKLVVEAL